MAETLKPELVPSPLWGQSFRSRMRRSEWDRLRKVVRDQAGGACRYCNAVYESKQICHEEWDYDEANGVVTLIGFAISCQRCNFALHIGRAGQPDVDRHDEGVEQMMKVKIMTFEEVQELIHAAVVEFRRRSKIEKWTFAVAPDVAVRFPILPQVLVEPTKLAPVRRSPRTKR